ncbi:hypothetical protein BH10PSE12_BH10PSE12_23200 [soil metagenome]
MSSRQSPFIVPAEISVRDQIKRTARLLIAERGVPNVKVREIALAANQRNLGIVGYYFETKDKLVSEILIDGADRIESRRLAYLAQLEARGEPITVEDAVSAIVTPSAAFSDEDALYGSQYSRFFQQLAVNDARFIDRTLEGRSNQGYQRCLAHLRTLTPHLDRATQSRRFLFLSTYVNSVLAAREAMLADDLRAHPTWGSREMLEDIIRTAAALICTPV